MTKKKLTENDVQIALDNLILNAAMDAKAKADRELTRDFVAVVLAQLKRTNLESGMSDSKATALALCDPKYKEAINAKAAAIELNATQEFKRQHAERVIDVWRTQHATQRAIGKV